MGLRTISGITLRARSATASALGEACRVARLAGVEIHLLGDAAYPEGLLLSDALRQAVCALRDRFVAMLSAQGLSTADIRSATLAFRFTGGADDSDAAVRSTIVDRRGYKYSHEFGFRT